MASKGGARVVQLSFAPEAETTEQRPVWRRPVSAKHKQKPTNPKPKLTAQDSCSDDDAVWDDPVNDDNRKGGHDRAMEAHLKRMKAARKKVSERPPENVFDRSAMDREFAQGSKGKKPRKQKQKEPKQTEKQDTGEDRDLHLRAVFIQNEIGRLQGEHRRTLRQTLLTEKRGVVQRELEEFETRMQASLTDKIAGLMQERDDRQQEARAFQAELRKKILHLQEMDSDITSKIGSMESAFKRNVIALEDEYARKVNDERERLIRKLDNLEQTVDDDVDMAERLSFSLSRNRMNL